MIIFGHRGAPGSPPHTENTVSSFSKALDCGANGLEFDIRRCRDGRMVVIHDETIDRTTKGKGRVADLSYEDLKQFDAGGGEPIPLLSDVLDQFGTRCVLNIELKDAGLGADLKRLLLEKRLERHVIVSAFDWNELRSLTPEVPVALLTSKLENLIAAARNYGAAAIHPRKDVVAPTLLAAAREAKLRVHVWTVNEPSEIARFRTLGVDGIFTDFPRTMFDVCIIGAGGIVGCSIARELALRGMSVAALEKHGQACQETSSLNSRVIHSGFHEGPGTLKATLAREGSRLILQYAQERGIKYLKTGMLIAVPHGGIQSGLWKKAGSLWSLWMQARRQNIRFKFVVTPGGIRKVAPIRALGGIFIPTVAVIDLEAFAKSLAADAVTAGAALFYGSEVSEISADADSYTIRTAKDEIRARSLINSAGLSAHKISRMAGGPDYEVEFLRGDYYELIGGVGRWKIQTLIYPAMPPGSRSKGVHFGPRTDGKLYLGPSASAAPAQAPRQLFLEAAQKFIPEVTQDDLRWAYAGTRPKNKSPDGKSDFIIRLDRTTPPLVNLIGIDSPGLSASMAIARYVANLITPSASRKTS